MATKIIDTVTLSYNLEELRQRYKELSNQEGSVRRS